MCDQKSYEAKPDLKVTPKPTMMDDLTAFKKKYEDLAKEAKIKETQGVKRKPLPNGTLELTKKELDEFSEVLFPEKKEKIIKVTINSECIIAEFCDNEEMYIDNYKAILWLANKFDLEV